MNAATENMFLTLLILFFVKGTSGTGDVAVPVCSGRLVQVDCSSWQYKYKACPVGDGTTVIDFAFVAKKQSVSACIFHDGNHLDYNGINGDYGYTKNILWVDNGCRAKFRVCLVPGCPGNLTWVNCSSWGYTYEECVVPGIILYAKVYDKQSVSACNSTGHSSSPPDYPQNPETTGIFGYQYDTLWVNSGCRAEFEVCYLAPCIIHGDPHVATPDGTNYTFGGVGLYYVIFEKNETFAIKGEFFACRPKHPHVSCLYALIIKFKIPGLFEIEIKIRLVRGGYVSVDGEEEKLPYESEDGKIKIFEVDGEIKLELDGLCILWDGIKTAVLKLPFSLLGIIMGLCGTFDFNAFNDLMLPDGTVVNNVTIFGNSWKFPLPV